MFDDYLCQFKLNKLFQNLSIGDYVGFNHTSIQNEVMFEAHDYQSSVFRAFTMYPLAIKVSCKAYRI